MRNQNKIDIKLFFINQVQKGVKRFTLSTPLVCAG